MLETARDQSHPFLMQVSFFLANKVGSLERVVHELDRAQVAIQGLSILDAHDHAVVRMIVDRPEKAETALVAKGHKVCSTRVLGVAVSAQPDAVSRLLNCLLRAELNVFYTYALITRHGSSDDTIVVLHPDDVDTATRVLRAAGFPMVTQRDLENDKLA